jgi:uncharacterized membrane protein YphA (DoxX/SURF4 family)
MIDPVIAVTVQLGLSVLFAVAAWHKLQDRPAFTSTLNDYGLTPETLNQQLTWVLIVTESGCALLLLMGQIEGVLLAATLLIVYGCIMAIKLLQGVRDIDCGCSGPARKQFLSGFLLIRNGCLFLLTLALLLPIAERELIWLDYLQTLFALTVVILLYSAMEHLLANRSYLINITLRQEQ